MRGRLSLRFWWNREDGASAVEYGLLVAGIAVLILGAVFALGDSVRENFFENTCSIIVAETGQGSC